MARLTIVSTRGSRSLTVRSDDDRWTAELHGEDVRAERRFHALGETGLDAYFGGLAASWRGWDGDRTWASLEGDVVITASHDGAGTIAMLVELRDRPRVRQEPDWRAALVLTLDAGALDRVARDARDVR